MTTPKPDFYWDDDLREVPRDREALQRHVRELALALEKAISLNHRVGYLGELGTYLRILGDLDDAEARLTESLRLVRNNHLGTAREVQQQIRLAHVYQWKRDFVRSDALFGEVTATCRTYPPAAAYLDFALQHAGKNFFDQRRLPEARACFAEALALRTQRGATREQIESCEIAIRRVDELAGK